MTGQAVFGGVFVALGAGIGAYYVRVGRSAQAARQWPVVDGTVSECRLEIRPSRYQTIYAPILTYQYTVNGRPYVGHRLAFGDVVGRKDLAQLWSERYQVGSSIRVHVDPRDSEEAVLEPRVAGSRQILALGAVAIIMGAGMLIGGR